MTARLVSCDWRQISRRGLVGVSGIWESASRWLRASLPLRNVTALRCGHTIWPPLLRSKRAGFLSLQFAAASCTITHLAASKRVPRCRRATALPCSGAGRRTDVAASRWRAGSGCAKLRVHVLHISVCGSMRRCVESIWMACLGQTQLNVPSSARRKSQMPGQDLLESSG